MTKTEIKRAINKAVYEYVTSLGYEIADDTDGSCVTFIPNNCHDVYEMIEYSRSYHETYVLKSALEETKADANKIDEFAKEQMRKYGV
jgi:hypothetical protein